SVTTIEIDERMIAMLRETLGERDNVRIVRADALAVDLYVQAERRPTRIVANLPYQITTPLLERFIGDARRPPLVVVLVQEEVARRIAATEKLPSARCRRPAPTLAAERRSSPSRSGSRWRPRSACRANSGSFRARRREGEAESRARRRRQARRRLSRAAKRVRHARPRR